jgi:hypothetical protein
MISLIAASAASYRKHANLWDSADVATGIVRFRLTWLGAQRKSYDSQRK